MESIKKTRRPRRKFTREFKADVVRLCQAGEKIRDVSKRLDLTETAVRSWVQAATGSEGNMGNASNALRADEREELERLRRELKRVTMERDILKKATAFFAKENG